jgi:hypothetical protein
VNDLTMEATLAPPSLAAMAELEARIQAHLNKRVRDFQLVMRGDGLVLHGFAATYYAKQLAQHAVLEATTLPILANEIQVC